MTFLQPAVTIIVQAIGWRHQKITLHSCYTSWTERCSSQVCLSVCLCVCLCAFMCLFILHYVIRVI